MVHDPLELVKLRSNFYRDSYRKVTMALLGSVVIIIALVGLVFFLISTKPIPKYFATTDSGRIIPLIPLDSSLLQPCADSNECSVSTLIDRDHLHI